MDVMQQVTEQDEVEGALFEREPERIATDRAGGFHPPRHESQFFAGEIQPDQLAEREIIFQIEKIASLAAPDLENPGRRAIGLDGNPMSDRSLFGLKEGVLQAIKKSPAISVAVIYFLNQVPVQHSSLLYQ